MGKLITYFHTLRYLRTKQIYYRLYYMLRRRVRRITKHRYPLSILKSSHPIALAPSLPCPFVGIEAEGVCFNNIYHSFPANDIDWNHLDYGMLWTFNLNYFEFLFQEGMTKEKGLSLIHDYIEKLPTITHGLMAYPIALRLIYWIRFIQQHDIIDERIDASLYAQAQILADNVEYHLMGNHVWEAGFGLLFASYYFRDDALYKVGEKIMREEMAEELLSDGGHFERSPMYHQLMLYRLLDVINLVQHNDWQNQRLLSEMQAAVSNMLSWLSHATFRNGDIPLVNDATRMVAPNSRELFAYAHRLGIEANELPLSDSGYRMIAHDDYELFVDVGNVGPDYIPGHAHSDTGNFLLYVDEKPIIIDTGISTYEKNERRSYERSTAAHNTVQIGEVEQTEVWGGFRVARRAKITFLDENAQTITCTHNGYQKLGMTHTRIFDCSKPNKIIIKDTIIPKNKQSARTYLHFAPDIRISRKENILILGHIKIHIEGSTQIDIQEERISFGYNQLIPTRKAVIYFSDPLQIMIQL